MYIVSYNGGQIKVVGFSELDFIYLVGFLNLQIYKINVAHILKQNLKFFS